MAIGDYNTNPDLNVTINGISIAEGMAPGDVNGAARQMMADLATFISTGGETHYSLRALVVPDGETGPTIPAIGTRKNKVLLFDNNGLAGVSAFTSSYSGSTSLMPDHRTVMAAYSGMTAGQSAILGEDGREGLFIWSAANLSAKVTADPQQGVYVAPASATTGASGAWVRKYNGPLNVKWFGAKGDGVTNDGTAVLAAITYANALSATNAGQSIPTLYFPAGKYILGTSTLDITRPIEIMGEGKAATVLQWTSGTTGIRAQHSNTTGATGVQADSGHAGTLSIRNLTLDGGYSSGAESDAYGIHARTGISGTHLTIQNWPGDGVYFRADTGDAAVLGNTNGSSLADVVIASCRKAVYGFGVDFNGCSFTNVRAFSNRQWGFHDYSFLGNSYVSPMSESNARTALNDSVTVAASYVTYSGKRYFVIPGQETWCSTNAPSGTTANNQGWAYWIAGGTDTGIPTWVSGRTYRAGGGYFIQGPTSTTTVVQPYCEDSETNLFDTSALVIGGLMTYLWKLSGGVLTAQGSGGPSRLQSAAGGMRTAGDLTVVGAFNPLGAVVLGSNTSFTSYASFTGGGIDFPTLTTRSVGTRTVLYPSLSGADVDFATGIGPNCLWWSVGNATNDFSWYQGTTRVMRITGGNIALDGAAAKVYINSQNVLGPRKASLGADATDLATCIALVNNIKNNVLRVTGGHGLVAD